jgi:hypothetical protein
MPDAKMTLSAAIKGRSISLSALLALLRSEHKDTITGTLESIDGREISVPLDSPMRSDGNLSLKLSNASLKDVNLVQQLLGQLAGLPFISESVTDKLPPEFRAVITAPNTSIKQFDLDTRTKSGKVEINKVRLTSDIFDLTGQGTFILDHALALKGDIRLSQALSRALIGQTPELKALADSDDRLTMPVEVTGSPSKPIVTPDLDAILKRTSVSALQRALEGGLKGSKGIGKKLRNIFRF